MLRDLFIILSVFVLFACGTKEEKSEKKSYNFTTNGCPTGEHSYSSTEELCAALQDDKVNNGCSYEMRKQMFQQNCSGEFAPHKTTADLNNDPEVAPDAPLVTEKEVFVERPVIDENNVPVESPELDFQ